MKYVKIDPAQPILALTGATLKTETGEDATVSFADFVKSRLVDRAFAKDMEGIFSAVKIRSLLERESDCLVLEDADHKRLLDAVKTPEQGYNPVVAMACAPFMRAICDAQDKA